MYKLIRLLSMKNTAAIQAPTGTGKGATLAKLLIEHFKYCLFLAPSEIARDSLPGETLLRGMETPTQAQSCRSTDGHTLARFASDKFWLATLPLMFIDEADVLSPASIAMSRIYLETNSNGRVVLVSATLDGTINVNIRFQYLDVPLEFRIKGKVQCVITPIYEPFING